MEYENYEKAVLIDLGITLDGWTHSTFASPLMLPLEIRPLETLLRAVKTGECCFRRITKAERVHHLHYYMRCMREGSSASTSSKHRLGDLNGKQLGK